MSDTVQNDALEPEMPENDLLVGLPDNDEPVVFTPTRAAGLARLDRFVGRTGSHYTKQRNYDFGRGRRTNVSALSPWIRHRLITEEEVLRATLARHRPSAAEKFIQEVFWRTYFKGWLEQRPSVWDDYQSSLADALSALGKDRSLRSDYEAAVEGRTGIDCLDAWSQELIETGYLHNHARMWFASIWIFTLHLPWELGADFFLRHLLDGDAASNTLSWRWVGGLHTKGKTYLARRDNIAKYTDGRFDPIDLAPSAPPLEEGAEHPRHPIPAADPEPVKDALLLVTEEDCRLQEILSRKPVMVLGVSCARIRSPLSTGALALAFTKGALKSTTEDAGSREPILMADDTHAAAAIIDAARTANIEDIVTGYAPVGPTARWLKTIGPELGTAGIRLHQIRRSYDDLAWPHATKGFFALKEKIPALLNGLGLSA